MRAAPFGVASHEVELEMRPVSGADRPPQRALPLPQVRAQPADRASAVAATLSDWQPVADEQKRVY
jgi:hypothetical protein